MLEARVRRLAIAIALAIGVGAIGARSARAVVIPVELELKFEINTIAPQVLHSTGVATVNGSGPGGHLHSVALAAGQLVDTTLVAITDPASAPITGVRLTASNGAGTIAETGGGALRGALGFPGAVAKVCLFGGGPACSAPIANLSVPLWVVGVGGFAHVTAAVNLTVIGAPWTTGQVAIGTITRMGFARGPASGTSSTGQPGGVMQLVTPLYITTNIAASVVIPIFATFTMRFVPEPTTIVLLGSGIAVLGWAGRRLRS